MMWYRPGMWYGKPEMYLDPDGEWVRNCGAGINFKEELFMTTASGIVEQGIKDVAYCKGHNIVINTHGDPVERVTIECADCDVVLYELPPSGE